eukprot:IDg21233t1
MSRPTNAMREWMLEIYRFCLTFLMEATRSEGSARIIAREKLLKEYFTRFWPQWVAGFMDTGDALHSLTIIVRESAATAANFETIEYYEKWVAEIEAIRHIDPAKFDSKYAAYRISHRKKRTNELVHYDGSLLPLSQTSHALLAPQVNEPPSQSEGVPIAPQTSLSNALIPVQNTEP